MPIEQYRAFIRVVEDGSFTAAGKTLGASKSFVSKQVSQLEDRLRVRLLNRTTRTVALTDAGADFFERAKQIVAEVEDAECAVSSLGRETRGRLKISLPMTFGLKYVSPLFPEFLRLYPRIAVDADFTDRKVDMVAEGYDMVVRVGDLADSSLIARRLAPIRALTCASPAYLAEHGEPTHPSDLAAHECLLYSYTSAAHSQSWRFTDSDGATATVRVRGRLLASAGDALRDSAVAGVGIARLPDFIVSDDLADGRLMSILPGWDGTAGAIWAVYPHSRHAPGKVRTMIDFLLARLPQS